MKCRKSAILLRSLFFLMTPVCIVVTITKTLIAYNKIKTKIEKWLGENKLTLNQQKTYLLTPSSPLLTNRANFSFNGVTIAYAQCVKYLGLHIHMNLTFKEHVKFVQKKNFWQHSTATIFQTVCKSKTNAAFIQDLHTTCFPIWSSDLWLCY